MLKRALVTGGTRGLGLEVARRLAERGYTVTVVGRSQERADQAARSLAGAGHRGWAFDLSESTPTAELCRRLALERFDLVVNNAGGSRFGPLVDLSHHEIAELVHLNFTAPVQISGAFTRTASPGAILVNVTSIVGQVPMPGNSVYSAAKAALTVLSECLWLESRAKGIRVLEFRPVSLRTDFHAHAGGDPTAKAEAGADASRAAGALLDALDARREFVLPHGAGGRLLGLAGRLLPRRVIIWAMGRRASRAGYLAARARRADATEGHVNVRPS